MLCMHVWRNGDQFFHDASRNTFFFSHNNNNYNKNINNSLDFHVSAEEKIYLINWTHKFKFSFPFNPYIVSQVGEDVPKILLISTKYSAKRHRTDLPRRRHTKRKQPADHRKFKYSYCKILLTQLGEPEDRRCIGRHAQSSFLPLWQ